MATLKDKINRILGNNVRLLLPSYWWKRVFGMVVDRIEEIAENNSITIVSSKDEMDALNVPNGSIASCYGNSFANCYRLSEEEFNSGEWINLSFFNKLTKIEDIDITEPSNQFILILIAPQARYICNIESSNSEIICAVTDNISDDSWGEYLYQNGKVNEDALVRFNNFLQQNEIRFLAVVDDQFSQINSERLINECDKAIKIATYELFVKDYKWQQIAKQKSVDAIYPHVDLLYENINETNDRINETNDRINETISDILINEEVVSRAINDLDDRLENKADKSSLSTVATSGSYNDLKDKPVIPEGITRNTYLMPNNGFSTDKDFGISYLNNTLYAADKRFVVETIGFSGGTDQLFDGSYEGGLTLTQGQTGTLTISNNGNNIINGYPYGDIILSFYYENVPESVSVEVYCNYEPQGIGWKTLNLKSIEGSQKGIYKFTNGFYNITQVRITITAKADISTSIVEIDWHLNRGRLGNYPVVTKYGLEQEMFGHYIFKDAITIGSKKISSIEDLNKQDTLVSGTNIKTINGESILGSGDITISGESSIGNRAYSEVNHGTSDTTFTLTPNTFHVWDEVASLTLDFGSEIAGVANEYLFQFTSGATATSLTLPDNLKWANDVIPSIKENGTYQISILKGLASVLEFAN